MQYTSQFLKEKCYFIGISTFKERCGWTYDGRYTETHDREYDVEFLDGQVTWHIHESELFFPNRGITNEIERLTECVDFPDGIPGDYTELYFQLLKALHRELKGIGIASRDSSTN